MRRDPTEFRKRFAAWKDGKKPYEAGLPVYKGGKTPHEEFVEQMGPVLYKELLRTNTPNIDTAYDHMLRQLAYESDYGRSRVAKQQHNYGGYGWNGKTYTTFKDDEDFVRHYVQLMNNRYEAAVNADSVQAYGKALKDKGYYEDTLANYTRNLVGMKSLSRSAAAHRQSNPNLYQIKPLALTPAAEQLESAPQFQPVNIVVPEVNTDYSLQNASMQSPAPQAINAWKGKGSPAYGGYSLRMPSIEEYMTTKNIMPRGFKDGKLPKYGDGTEPEPIRAAKEAINFAKLYYGSEGFNERFRNLNNATKGFLYSSYNPTASYWAEDNEWDPRPRYAWSVQKTPIKFRKVGPLPSPEANAYYDKYYGTIFYGDDRTLQRGYSKTWDEIMGHEAGHALDYAIKPMNNYLRGELDNYNGGYGYTYSNLYPIFRKSKSYQKVRNLMYNIDEQHGRLYDQDPSYGKYLTTDPELFHDAMPSESYADLFQLRKMLYDQKIFDSTRKGIKFTKQDFEKFKKNNHRIRLQDNFSDEDIIWMINNVANNTTKINPLSV